MTKPCEKKVSILVGVGLNQEVNSTQSNLRYIHISVLRCFNSHVFVIFDLVLRTLFDRSNYSLLYFDSDYVNICNHENHSQPRLLDINCCCSSFCE